MSDQFYIRIRGRVQGPFEVEKLRQLARRGQLSRLHEVSTDGQQWQSAKEFPELFAPVGVPVAAAVAAAPAAAALTPGSGSSGFAPPAGGPGPALSPTWYYAHGGREQGPVDFSTLANLFATRQLQPETEVWNQGMANWTSAQSVPGLVTVTAVSGTDRSVNGQPIVTQNSADSGDVSQAVIRILTESRPWVVFIAVIGFIYATLMLVGGILQMIVGARTAMFPITAGGLVNMILAVVVSIGAWLLVSYAGGISHVERSRRDQAICSALTTLKSFWVFVGIVLIVLLTLLLLFAILIVSMAGSIPDFS